MEFILNYNLEKLVLFKINHKVGNNAYVLDLPTDFQISPTFNVAEFEYHPALDGVVLIEDAEAHLSQERGNNAGA